MALFNVGSISQAVGDYIGWNIIATLSGTTLDGIVKQQINFINTFTNQNVGETGILEQFQPSLIDLTTSKVLIACEANQGGIDSIQLGELNVSQGTGGLSELAKQLREDAIARLREIGRYSRFARVIGG